MEISHPPIQTSSVDNNVQPQNSSADSEIDTEPIRTQQVTGSPTMERNSSVGHLALYEDDTSSDMPSLSTYLRTLAGVQSEEDDGKRGGMHGKAKLGTLLGVYLPSVQHILGVQMFLRLAWIVGIAGFIQSFAMVFLCCLCTFLTSISISAIATNGVIESGGAYFMISRNLGAEFGGAIGILYYLGNTVAAAMYLVGGVEVLLKYMAPGLPQFGDPAFHSDDAEFNNFRIYGTIFLIVLFIICALGVRFVQLFAPVSLACVVLSILAVFIGGFTANPKNSPKICVLGDVVVHTFPDFNSSSCNKTQYGPLWNDYCTQSNTSQGYSCDSYFDHNEVRFISAIPGFGSGVFSNNLLSTYMEMGESTTNRMGIPELEVSQDIRTTFFILLAIFFPSVTGIMTGANMSGDLADPQKSIPIGTIAAQLTTSLIYLLLVGIYAGTVHGTLLRDKYGESIDSTMVAAMLSWPSAWILLVGSFTSCIGAGLQCLCTAPRLLQSIAKDDLIPFLRIFAPMTKRNEPFRALILTAIIAECAILIGGIDYIAPVVDFFFLMSYCFVNVACALQTWLKVPNWRPRFRFYHWSLAVLGALLNLFIMFSTYWYYALVVLILCAALYKYIEFKGANKEWGDGMRGLALSTAQYSLLSVEEEEHHPKNWRPQLLVLLKLKTSEEYENRKMLHLANQLKAGRGLTMVATLIQGDLLNPDDREQAKKAKQKLKIAMQEAKVKGFTEVALCSNISDNVGTFIQCVGMGRLRPNTVFLGWPYRWRLKPNKEEGDTSSGFLNAVHRATAADMCLLVAKGLHMFPDAGDQLCGEIDVWWIIQDGGLLILLPFLLRQHRVWRKCALRIFAVAQYEDNTIKMKKDLEKWVYQLRIQAQVHIVELDVNTIAAYTYEKTIMMEERTKLAHDLRLSDEEVQHEPQFLADRCRSVSCLPAMDAMYLQNMHAGNENLAYTLDDDNSECMSIDDNKGEHSSRRHSVSEEPEIEPKAHTSARRKVNQRTSQGSEIEPFDKKKMQKMRMAIKLNKAIREKSSTSRLVILNLPKPPRAKEALPQYMEYLEALTEDLERVLLVRGSGKEVITIYS